MYVWGMKKGKCVKFDLTMRALSAIRNRSAFTLTELLIIVLVVTVFAAIIIPNTL